MDGQKFNRQIAGRMDKLRRQLGITTTELAALVGISQAQISRLGNGRQGFRSFTLAKIANALSVPPSYFVIEDESLAQGMADPTFRQFAATRARVYLETQKLGNT